MDTWTRRCASSVVSSKTRRGQHKPRFFLIPYSKSACVPMENHQFVDGSRCNFCCHVLHLSSNPVLQMLASTRREVMQASPSQNVSDGCCTPQKITFKCMRVGGMLDGKVLVIWSKWSNDVWITSVWWRCETLTSLHWKKNDCYKMEQTTTSNLNVLFCTSKTCPKQMLQVQPSCMFRQRCTFKNACINVLCTVTLG